MKYPVRARIDQIVSSDIMMEIEAKSEEEAQAKAKEALQTFPDEHKAEGVLRMLILERSFWIPRDITFIPMTEETPA